MQPPAIIFDNLADKTDTVITVTSESATLPKENLIDDRLAKVSRLDAVAAQYWRFALGAPRFVSAVAILAHNFSFAADVTVTGFSDSGFTTQVVSQTEKAWPPLWGAGELGAGVDGAGGAPTTELIGGRTNIVFILIPQSRAQWWEIKVDDPTNTDGYLEAGKIFLGGFFQLARYPAFPARKKHDDASRVDKNEFGAQSVNAIKGKRAKKFLFDRILASEQRSFEDLQRDFGRHKPFLFFVNPDKADTDWFFEFMYCTMARINEISRRNAMFWRTNLELTEF